MSSSILSTGGRAAALSACAAALVLAAAAPSAFAASATISSTKMLSILQQPSADFATREQSAPPQIKSELLRLRQTIGPNAKFTVGYTSAMDLPLDALAGTRIPKDPSIGAAVNARGMQLYKLDIDSAKLKAIDATKLTVAQCSSSWSSFDWRKQGKVTPVKSQICGTCWDFTAMGAYEGSYAIRNKSLVDTSEQYNLNCANAGSCAGGWWMPVFDHMITKGTAAEASYPFTGNDGAQCPLQTATPFRATSWGFVGPNQTTIPSASAIKAALCQHGPLATAVQVDGAFQGYTGGVFDEHTQHFDWINHGVTIIGWDDSKHAWLIKNSWGTAWGETGGYGSERGYMWIDYGTNNIGIATAWVDARSNRWDLIAAYDKLLMAQYKIIPDPEPQPDPVVKTKLLQSPAALQTQPTVKQQQMIKTQPLLTQPQ